MTSDTFNYILSRWLNKNKKDILIIMMYNRSHSRISIDHDGACRGELDGLVICSYLYW